MCFLGAREIARLRGLGEINAQFKAAPLNSRALGKYINKVDQVDQFNREIEKIRLRRAAPAAGFLKHPGTPKITTPKLTAFF
jgi:hypothetical protein